MDLDLLSSVAVVGQGRPSLGDAHNQFFCKERGKYNLFKQKHKNKSVCHLHSKQGGNRNTHYVV